jgi:hypothetical protein
MFSMYTVFHAGVASAALCIQGPNGIQRYIGNTLPMITYSTTSFDIVSVWSKTGFCDKATDDIKPSRMTQWKSDQSTLCSSPKDFKPESSAMDLLSGVH